MKINRYLLLVWSCVVSFSYAQIKITFFEVGQGHCTLICADNEPPILVDGGSLSADYTEISRESFKAARITEIVKKIEEHAKVTGKFELTVIVSHPDPDHYNWLEKIMTDCIALKIPIARIILGCAKKLYDESSKYKEFPAMLKKISEPAVVLGGAPLRAAGDELLTEITYLTEKGDTQVTTTVTNTGPFVCEILPAKACRIKKDVNDGSLVVSVRYGKLGCLLMGDATGERKDNNTLDHILKYWHPLISYALLQASHHGSDQHGCNRDSWLNLIRPTAIVFSSGKQAGKMEMGKVPKGNKLPHIGTAKRMLPILPIVDDGSYHLLITGNPVNAPDENRQELERVKFTNGYRMGAIQRPLYGTLSNGTVIFAWDVADTVLPPAQFSKEESGKSVGFPSAKAAIMHGLMNPRYGLDGCFGTGVYQYIDLSSLKFDDSIPADWESLNGLLSRLRTHGKDLQVFIADDNALKLEKTMDLLVNLFKYRTSIKRMSVLKSYFALAQLARLQSLSTEERKVAVSAYSQGLRGPLLVELCGPWARPISEIVVPAAPAAPLPAHTPVTPEKAKIRVSPSVASPLAVLNSD